MDTIYEQLTKNVKTVEQYDSITQEIMNKCKNTKVINNMTTALVITKVRSFEVEYFSKSHKNGAACFLFESLLSLPPSKTWGMMKKELISSLQYWLQAIKTRLQSNNDLWWKFLKLILKFIKEISVKDPSVPNKLVELTAESLFDIATRDGLNDKQRHEILHCLCIYCAESGREVRLALRIKFSDYFTKLASQLLSSSYLPLQLSSLEALVRWLVPRGEPTLRVAAAERWFPPEKCTGAAREVFLNAAWFNFLQDARHFLNVSNEATGLVCSVPCKRLSVGEKLIITGSESQQTWLDINSGSSSLSVILDPRTLRSVTGRDYRACEPLLIESAETDTVRLHSESRELTLSVSMHKPPRIQPSDLAVDGRDVTIVVSSRTDVTKMDVAIRDIFGDKYQVLMNIDAGLRLSPTREIKINSSSEGSRFSHPVEVERRRPTEYGVAYKKFRNRFRSDSLASPSTASTTSLAQLRYKLEARPRQEFPTEFETVCAKPQLSNVTEISETDDLNSFHSGSAQHYAPFNVGVAHRRKDKAESDSELLKQNAGKNTLWRPIASEEHPTSCLLVATLGTDDSVISDTKEQLSKSKDFDPTSMVDRLVKEALEAELYINSDEKKNQDNEDNSEAIENIPIEVVRDFKSKSKVAKKKRCVVISKSTTEDESNTEAILETPAYVTTRRTKNRPQTRSTAEESKKAEQSFQAQHVEDFFSQHIAETKKGGIEISPALARKVNQSSSASQSLDENSLILNYDMNVDMEQFEINDIDVIECLNDMLDEVCSDLLQYFHVTEQHAPENSSGEAFANNQTDTISNTNTPNKKTNSTSKPKKNIKSNAGKAKKPKLIAKKMKNQNNKKTPTKMSTIIERNDEEILEICSPKHNIENIKITEICNSVINKQDEKSPATENLVAKRKRKLYSPKDDTLNEEKKETESDSRDEDNINLAALKKLSKTETPKRSTCYKELEKERKMRIRQPRSRKSRGNFVKSPSPNTLENDVIFDKLKSTVENNEKVILVDKKSADVYNFSSGSEDSDFEVKRIELRKRLNSKTVLSSESSMSAKPGKRSGRNVAGKFSNEEAKKRRQVKKKLLTFTFTKKTNNKKKAEIIIEPPIELEDERMRATVPEEVLNTSIVHAKRNTGEPEEVDFVLNDPQMELITDDQESAPKQITRKKKLNKNTKLALTLKKEGSKTPPYEDSGTLSPLPGLIVEAVPKRNDNNDLNIAAMERKIQQICEKGPDAINETTTTQNILLSDFERCNTPHNVSANIIDTIYSVEEKKLSPTVERNISKKAKLTKNADCKSKTNYIREIKKEKRSPNINNNTIDVIDIGATCDLRSEKSISTDEIRAHVNSDDCPPSPGLLEKTIPSRDIVDMNDITKKFFMTLNRELYVSRSTSRERTKKTKDTAVSKPSSPSSKLLYDMRKMVPSRRTSDSSFHSAPSSPINELKPMRFQQKLSKDIQERNSNLSRCSNDLPKEKHPIVSLVRLSLEDIARLSSPEKLQSKQTSNATLTSKSQGNSPMSVFDTRIKHLKNTETIFDEGTSEECDINPKEKDPDTPKRFTRSLAVKKNESQPKSDPLNMTIKSRLRSTISPINLKFIIPQRYDSNTSSPITRKVSNKRVKKNLPTVAKTFKKLPSPDTSSEVQMPSHSTKRSQQKSSPIRVLGEPYQRPTKRKNVSPIRYVGKISRNELNTDTTDSGPSIASVHDWFRRNEVSTQETNAWALVSDSLKNVREKIDTSLVESNQNTSKKFVEFFNEVQDQFSNLQRQQREIYAAAEKRSEELASQFMEKLRRNLATVVSQDQTQKELVAVLLKEDVQAALDQVERT